MDKILFAMISPSACPSITYRLDKVQVVSWWDGNLTKVPHTRLPSWFYWGGSSFPPASCEDVWFDLCFLQHGVARGFFLLLPRYSEQVTCYFEELNTICKVGWKSLSARKLTAVRPLLSLNILAAAMLINQFDSLHYPFPPKLSVQYPAVGA